MHYDTIKQSSWTAWPSFLGLLDPEDGGTTLFPNTSYYLPVNTA